MISPIKLDLERNNLPLRLFFFTVQIINEEKKKKSSKKKVEPIPEDSKVFACYTDEEAMNLLRGAYVTGTKLSVRQRATVPVKDIVNVLNIPVLNVNAAETNMPTFLSALMILNEQLMKNAEDKEVLHKIIEGLKRDYGN